MDERAHERKDVRIVRCRGKHEFSVPERILDGLWHIVTGEVGDRNLGAAALEQFLLQEKRRRLRVAVHARVGDANAFALDGIRAPDEILLDGMGNGLTLEDRTMKRTYRLNVKTGGLLE